MGFIDVASNSSLWRGIDYYNDKMVISCESTGENTYSGLVHGSGDNRYHVHIDIAHPRSSTCTCPFASDRKVVCKHMIAMYFTIRPQAAADFLKKVEQWKKEAEEAEKKRIEEIKRSIKRMKKSELQEKYFDALMELEELKNRYW